MDYNPKGYEKKALLLKQGLQFLNVIVDRKGNR
jgi:hypothetical protein